MNIIPKHNPPRTENISFFAKFSDITVMMVKAKRIWYKLMAIVSVKIVLNHRKVVIWKVKTAKITKQIYRGIFSNLKLKTNKILEMI